MQPDDEDVSFFEDIRVMNKYVFLERVCVFVLVYLVLKMVSVNAYVAFYIVTLLEYWHVSTMFHMINKRTLVEVSYILISLTFLGFQNNLVSNGLHMGFALPYK